MNVHEIGSEAFKQFADDLLSRLHKMGESRPTVWVPVGNSGSRVVQAIASAAGDRDDIPWSKALRVVPLAWDPDSHIHRLGPDDERAVLGGASILVVDSIANSGKTLREAVRLLTELSPRPAARSIYTVALRHGSDAIPNLFSLLVGPSDRLFLPWHQVRPNNRLTLTGIYRSLLDTDLERNGIDSSQDFINRVMWKDRWYSLKRESNRRVIVCEISGEIAAFVNFTVDSHRRELQVDEIGSARNFEGLGIAGALLRFSETVGRTSGCNRMTLWAHEDVVTFYQNRSFFPCGPEIACGDDGKFLLMERSLGSSKSEREAG